MPISFIYIKILYCSVNALSEGQGSVNALSKGQSSVNALSN